MASQFPLLASLARRSGGTGGAGADVPPAGGAAPGREGRPAPPRVAGPAKEKRKVKVKRPKNAPQEVSSKRPVAPKAAAKRNLKTRARDPRFDDLSGKLDVEAFEKSYAFLDEYRAQEFEQMQTEVKTLQKRQKRRKSANLAAQEAELRQEMRRRVQQDKQRRHHGEMQAAERELRREERKKVQETGKTPFFHSNSAVRALVRQKRKGGGRGGGARDKPEERREKKLAAKEKRRLPARRSRGDGD